MYLKQLVGFLIKASRDNRIGSRHVAIYIAIFQQWCIQNGESPVSVSETGITRVAKIGRTTYHKCMRELEMYGYIKYVRSYSPILGSMVYLVELDR